MTWMPFVCLGIGMLIGWRKLSDLAIKAVDTVINISLVALMLTIGMNIGINDSVMKSLGGIGINCAVIALLAMAGSIFLVILLEKTIVPLEGLREKLAGTRVEEVQHKSESGEEEEKKKGSALLWLMPGSIVSGVLLGHFLLTDGFGNILGYSLTISLVVLYTGVGVSLATNRNVFGYIKIVGIKIVFISLAICVGSLAGGALGGLVLGVPLHVSVTAASGMSYYSLTGAYMTQAFGIADGTYGFIVNVMREFFTVLLLPLIVKISKGSPIAAGAAGNMDTLLVPVTKFVGTELGLVALITGVILTFVVPFILPALSAILY